MNEQKIARINELYHKSKAEGLTEAEQKEQQILRREYIDSFRQNLRSQLDQISIQEADGSITNLGEKFGNKKEIRQWIRQKRRELEEDVWRNASGDIAAAVVSHSWFTEAEEIYTYVDYNREAGTRKIIETAFAQGKNVWVPKVTGKTMHFYRIESLTELRPGTCGIPEPAGGGPMDGSGAGLMLMPGVAFDEKRHRVGYGGGYYDRYLVSHPGQRKMALAFEFQILRSVPYEEYDIRPEIVVTEKRMIRNGNEGEGE